MNCREIQVYLHWIRCAAMDGRDRLDNGDSTGVESSLNVMEQNIAAIRRELKKGAANDGQATNAAQRHR